MILATFQGASETRDAGSGRANLFGSAHAHVQSLEPDLAQRHQAGIKIDPNKEQQERRGEIVFVLKRVVDGGGEVKPQGDLEIRHPTVPVSVTLAPPGARVAFDAVFGSSREFGVHAEKG